MTKYFLLLAALCFSTVSMQGAYIMGFSNTATIELSVTTTTGVFSFNAFDSGWYDSTGSHTNSNDNYIISDPSLGCTGCDGFAQTTTTHDYFAFRLGNSTVTGNVLSATLSVPNPVAGYLGPVGGLLVSLWDVTTDLNTVVANAAGQVGTYNDLGSGVLYSTRVVGPADNGTNILFNLNANALTAIASASGPNGTSLFGIGGSLGNTAVPEPSALALLAVGLLGFGIRLRKR
jgi:hypothetical protein